MSGGAGVEIDDVIVSYYQNMKLGKMRKAWLVAKLTDDKKKIVLDDTLEAPEVDKDNHDESENRENFNTLVSTLTDAEPRYIVFDFRFMKNESQKVGKLAYILWISDQAPVGKKMVYATSSTTIKKKLDGINAEFQLNEMADLNYESMKDEVARK